MDRINIAMKYFTAVLTFLIAMSMNIYARSYTADDLSGTWRIKNSSGFVLDIKSDGTYSLCIDSSHTSGKWTLIGRFIVLKHELPIYGPLEGRLPHDFDIKEVKICRKDKIFWGYRGKMINRPPTYKKGKRIYLYKAE